jgi:hypothetical protein
LDDVNDHLETPNNLGVTLDDYKNFTSWLANETVTTYNMRAGIMGGANMIGDAAFAAQFHFAAAVGCFAAGTCGAWSQFKQGEGQPDTDTDTDADTDTSTCTYYRTQHAGPVHDLCPALNQHCM